MGGRLATRYVAALAVAIGMTVSLPARAGEDDLALDLGSSSDKPSDAGTALRRLELRRVPKGTFVEGSPSSDAYREPDEVQRTVTISKTFWMGKYPITRAQFARFVAETRHQTDAEKGQSGGFGWDGARLKQSKEYTWRSPGFTQTDDDPVTLVTFGDANAFTAWASRKTGRRVRLPTEAEFEYAARGGTTTPWYSAKSEEEATGLGWFRPQPGAAIGTHPVGRKKPNAFGLYDMAGNVNQWCRDVYSIWPATDATDPENTANTTSEPERRVLRGGSWMREPRRSRSAARFKNTPGTRNADNGFRVVVEDAPSIVPAPGLVPSADVAPSAMLPGLVEPPSTLLDGGGLTVQPTPVIQRPPSTEGIAWSFLAAPAAAISFVVAWMLARRKKEATNAQGITTRAGDDGFWVRAPHLPPKSRVRYTCIVKGSEVSDIIPLDGGEETFVFTGGQPSMIQISEAAAVSPGAPGYRSSAQMPAVPPAPTPGSVPPSVPPSFGQRSPWPSDRGSVRSIGAIAASAPPPVPSRPPPLPSSRPVLSAPPPSDPPGPRSEPFLGYPGAYR